MDNDKIVTTLLFVYNDTTAQKKKSDEIDRLPPPLGNHCPAEPMPIILVDMKFHIQGCERRVCTFKRYRSRRVLKMTLRDFRVLDQSGEGLKQVIQDKRPTAGEVLVEFPPRSKAPAAVWYSPPGHQR